MEEGKKKTAVAAESDREETIGEKERMPPKNNDGPGMRAGVESSNLI